MQPFIGILAVGIYPSLTRGRHWQVRRTVILSACPAKAERRMARGFSCLTVGTFPCHLLFQLRVPPECPVPDPPRSCEGEGLEMPPQPQISTIQGLTGASPGSSCSDFTVA